MVTGGPLSISRELSQLHGLEGVKEVNVRLVDKDEVGIDLLELRFKVQNTTCLSRLALRVCKQACMLYRAIIIHVLMGGGGGEERECYSVSLH